MGVPARSLGSINRGTACKEMEMKMPLHLTLHGSQIYPDCVEEMQGARKGWGH